MNNNSSNSVFWNSNIDSVDLLQGIVFIFQTPYQILTWSECYLSVLTPIDM